jgi:hypothetical protein
MVFVLLKFIGFGEGRGKREERAIQREGFNEGKVPIH